MSKVIFLFVVLAFFNAANAEEGAPVQLIVSTIGMMPTTLLDSPGDWYEIQYGHKADLIKREAVTVRKVEKPEDPKYMVVGFIDTFADNDDTKKTLVSYVGDEHSVREIGTEVINADTITLLTPYDFAAKFGWKKE